MANILPLSAAEKQMADAITAYEQALADFVGARRTNTKRLYWRPVVDAYSKVSAAQWELEQAVRAAGLQ